MEVFVRITFLFSILAKQIYGDEVVVYVNVSKPIFTINSKSPSVALGMNIFAHGWQKYINNPKLLTLARALEPAYIRMGGIRADHATFHPNGSSKLENPSDCIGVMPENDEYQKHLMEAEEQEVAEQNKNMNFSYTGADFDQFMKFVRCSRWDLVYGLNFLGEKRKKWDPTNSLQLLRYAKMGGYSINWELGNEPNSYPHKEGYKVTPNRLAKAFNRLKMILNSDPWWKNSRIVGPDANSMYRSPSKKFLNKFLHYAKYIVNASTFHHYYVNKRVATLYNFTDPALLDELKPILKAVVEIQKRQTPNIPIWLGETGSASGGGAKGLSDTFVAGFMWLDKLGLSAAYGIDVVFRQTFFHGYYALVDENFNPRPDYWLTLLYKRLVGQRVFAVTKTNPKESSLIHTSKFRVYAHCTKPQRFYYFPGSVTVFYLNLSKSNKTMTIKMDGTKSLRTAYVYILTPPDSFLNSSDVSLNGEKLQVMSIYQLPPLHPKLVNFQIGEKLILPKMSFGFIVLPDFHARACLDK